MFSTQYTFAIYYASDRYTNSGDPEYIGLAGASSASRDVSFTYYNNPSILGLKTDAVDPTFIFYQGDDNLPVVHNSIPNGSNNIYGVGLGISAKFTDRFGMSISYFSENEGYSSNLNFDTVTISTGFLNLNAGYKIIDNLSLGFGFSKVDKTLNRENNLGEFISSYESYRIISSLIWNVYDDLLINVIYTPDLILRKKNFSNNLNPNEDISFIEPGKLQIGGLYSPNMDYFYFSKMDIMTQLQIYYYNTEITIFSPYSLLNENTLNTQLLSTTLSENNSRYSHTPRFVPKIGIRMLKEYSKHYNYKLLVGTYLEPATQDNTLSRPHLTFGVLNKLKYINLGFSTDFGYSNHDFSNYFIFCLSFGLNFDEIF